ncbi:LysR family transcriptional regulator [Rhodobacter sp. NTK016B]|uniref:LysR family transcriptional regulator n=1 Tax=Rhodobacter sp. NTK016B TaxID=2759676 RepID=UPI001A8C2201|nr:LysR family transcriptional regulator [Rhodobacter sp. NTK016B]MBN8291285.1 LysR family transcriptional regulator [Rhodobacter sp. NTK016B]
MLNFTIRQLRAIQTISDCGSFAAAARQLNVSAAALSAMIRETEASIGFRVFERTTRSLSLTDTGAEFLPHVQRILLELERADTFVRRRREVETATLRIAATQFLSCTILPPLLQAFRTAEPEARLQLIDSAIDDVIETVRSGEADLGVYLDVDSDETLEAVPLFRSALCVVMAPTHPLASLPRIAWAQLAGHEIIYLGREDQLRRNLADAGIALDLPHQRVAHGTSALALIAAGEGIAVMTRYVQPMLPIYGLRMVPLVNPSLDRQVVVVHRRKTHLSRLARKFVAFAREAKMGE